MRADRGATIGALLATGAARLRKAGLEDPRREAVWLWADLRSESPAAAAAEPGRAVPASEAGAYELLVARRAAGEPLAYVTGRAGFRRLVIRSDRRALIPRPETEGLVDLLLERQREGRVADVGTGSGCLALALADEGSFDLVVGLDRSAPALGLAAENRRVTGLDIALVQGDLTTAFRGGRLDAVVSNPPYLTEGEYQSADPSVRDWEPRAALASGPDGLDATTTLLRDAMRVVRPGGWLAIEVDSTRGGESAQRATALGWKSVSIHRDLYGRERYLLAQRSEGP